ncbi:MAG TPA: hypothetical protein VM680_14265 [Verrucomicrobiae bacterium]|nr:hypothetical protein [Verrucomicrobiae bacterium]
MKLLPVVGRELRAIARRPSAYWVRSGAALAAFVAMGYVALIGAAGLPTANLGRSLFEILSLGAFAYCALAGVRGTSDALSQEKREGTLGLLFLTDLKGYDVVFGKLVSVSINSVYGILAVAPPLALAFMAGGTSALQFVMMLAVLFNTLFFSLSVGIFVSTFSEQERPAMGGTLAIVFLALVMPYAIAMAHTFGILEVWEVMESGFLLTSPAFAYWSIKSYSVLRIYLNDVLLSLAFTHLAGWLCLVVASASVAQRCYAEAPRGKLMGWLTRVQQEWAYGKAERRQSIRRRLLDRNAFAWLAGRDRLKQRYAWIFLCLLGGLWAVVRWKSAEATEEWPVALFSLWFVQFFFKVWVASEVAARFIEDRRSNGLELLLTTPLRLREFAGGQRLALFRQFGPPLALIVAVNLFVGWRAGDSSAYLLRSSNPAQCFIAGLIHLAVDLYAVHWVSIWRSMRLRGANRVIVQTVVLINFLPLLGWFLLWQVSWLASLGSAWRGEFSATRILWIWTALCVVYDLTLVFIARGAFFRDFREVATKTFDAPQRFTLKWRRPTKAVKKPAPPTRKWSRARKVALGCAVALLCAYGAATVRKQRMETQASARLAAIRAAGLPVFPDDVPRWKISPPAGESASAILRQASKALTVTARPIRLSDEEAQWNSREKLPLATKERFSAWLREHHDLVRALDELPSCKPGSLAGADRYRTPIEAEEIARILQFKARIEMEDDPVAAARTITVLLHFARDLQAEHIFGFVNSVKAMQITTELLERAAAQGNFSTNDWTAWKNLLGEMTPVETLQRHLIVERTDGIDVFTLPVDMLYQRFGRMMSPFPGVFNVSWSLRRFLGQDKAELIEYLDYMDKYIREVEQPFVEIKGARVQTPWRAPSFASSTFLTSQIMPDFYWLMASATELVAYQRVLMSACDVEILRGEKASLPTADDVASFLRIDPFTDKPLKFVRSVDGCAIYSLGEDMKDDGGMTRASRHQGDVAFHWGKPPERPRIIKKR